MFPSPSLPPPPPPPPPCPPQWKYDVFVSFQGKDLRRNFMSHLFSALKQASIRCFRDKAIEDIGEEIKSEFVRVIWYSRFALIVLSKNYADSKWCMNELVEILECKKRYENHGHLVVPIFLNVKPEDISKLTSGSEFAQGFERLCGKERDYGQIQKWRDALTETKHLLGVDLRNDAGEGQWVDNRPPSGAYKGTNGGLAICLSACADEELAADTSALYGKAMSGAMTSSFIRAIREKPGVTYKQLLKAMQDVINEANKSNCLNSRNLSKLFHAEMSQASVLSCSEMIGIENMKFEL